MSDSSRFVIGGDFGTDSVRCILVDVSSGKVLRSSVKFYPRWKQGMYCKPSENRYRQHPLDYIEAFEACVRELVNGSGIDSDAIDAISFDTTASTPVLISRDCTPLSLMDAHKENPDAMFVLWKDHTAMEEADRINELAASWSEDYTRFSGGRYSCEWAWAKMLHVLKSSPELVSDSWSWAEHCDWLAAMLVGCRSVDAMPRSRCAAGHKAMWNEAWGGLPPFDYLKAVNPLLGIFEGHMYTTTSTSDASAGGLCAEWASRLGLREGIAVGVGAIDCHFGAVGAGIAAGTLVKVMGTSTCDIAVAGYDELGPRLVRGICGQVDGSVLPGYVGLEAGQAAFGDVYAWFRRILSWVGDCGFDILSRLNEEAALLPLTVDDMVALDWFNGRRTPDSDQRVKACISGLTMSTTAPQIFKALVEATVFGSRAINERFLSEGVEIREVIAVGGISRKSPFVMQTMADVTGMPIKVSASDQACALGAAMFASVAAGLYPSVAEAQASMSPSFEKEYVPDPARHEIYNVLYAKYKELGQ